MDQTAQARNGINVGSDLLIYRSSAALQGFWSFRLASEV
jgi:hypothetical protein